MDEQPIPPIGEVPQPPQNESVVAAPATPGNDVAENKDIAALAYVWVMSVFVLFYRHKSPFARFHGIQGTALFIISIAGFMLPSVMGRLVGLIVLALSAWGFVSAAQGKWTQLPIIYPLAHGDFKALRQNWKSLVEGIAHLWHRLRNRTGKERAQEAHSAPVTVPPTPPTV